MKPLLRVDLQDRMLGYTTKQTAHKDGLLHRAFSVFLYHDGQMLLQKRAMNKYHTPGLWTNACCSHPWQDGSVLPRKDTAAGRDRRGCSGVGRAVFVCILLPV